LPSPVAAFVLAVCVLVVTGAGCTETPDYFPPCVDNAPCPDADSPADAGGDADAGAAADAPAEAR
jgi:hypothetical protein